MNSRAVKLAVSLLLTVSMLCCSVSVFADYETVISDETTFLEWYEEHVSEWGDAEDAEDAYQALGVYGIWAIMNASGIALSVDEVYTWSDAMYYAMEQEIREFLATIPSINWLRWIQPWMFGFTASGLFQCNNTMLEDVDDFIDWIRDKYSLQDNSISSIDTYLAIPVYNDAAVPVYVPIYMQWPEQLSWRPYIDGNINFFEGLTTFQTGKVYKLTNYYFRIYDNGSTVTLQFSNYEDFVSLAYESTIVSSNIYEQWTTTYPSDDYYNGTGKVPIFYNDSVSDAAKIKFATRATYNENNGRTIASLVQMSYSTFVQYFYPREFGTIAETATITLPTENPDYTPGDMAVLEDGTIIYLSIDFPESINVNNLPAVISKGEIENPEVDQIYTNIPAFFQMAGDTMNGFKQILFRMPDEVLICIYAVLSVGVLFGFLRIMREH